jgi:signal transduction histidine kinase
MALSALSIILPSSMSSSRVWSPSSAVASYGFAVLSFAVTFACVIVIDNILDASPPVSLFLCAIIFVAWFTSLGPALLTTGLSVLAFGYFYLLPLDSLTLVSKDVPRIILFGIAAVFIAVVSAAQRKAAASLRQARDQLQDAVHDLEIVNQRLLLENRVATLGEMNASIAHDVIQPLTAIVTQGEANLRWLGRPSPEIDTVRRGVEQMIESAERAANVVNRIRALSKKRNPELIPLDVNEVINDVVRLTEREIASHRIALRLELAAALPPVLGDRVQLQQVVINLMINAIQALAGTEEGARSLVVRSEHYHSDQVLISVRDSGPGIAAETANRLFDPFYTTKPNGTGMGLSISRSIIEAHGGRIWASSDSGTGATFQFTLPARQPSAHESPSRGERLNSAP